MLDTAIVARAFGSYPGDPRWNPLADVNKDHKVDMLDVALSGQQLREISPKSLLPHGHHNLKLYSRTPYTSSCVCQMRINPVKHQLKDDENTSFSVIFTIMKYLLKNSATI